MAAITNKFKKENKGPSVTDQIKQSYAENERLVSH